MIRLGDYVPPWTEEDKERLREALERINEKPNTVPESERGSEPKEYLDRSD